MKQFKKNDRVVRIQVTGDRNMVEGAVGTVLRSDVYRTSVEWDEIPPLGGHDCGGTCKEGYGWIVPTRDLDYLESTLIDDAEYDVGAVVSMLDLFLTNE